MLQSRAQDIQNPLLNQLLQSQPRNSSKAIHDRMPNELMHMIEAKGISGIQNYICSLKSDQIFEELILKLDALRSAMLFSGLSLHEILSGTFIQAREVQNA